jgi:hypothetical protein
MTPPSRMDKWLLENQCDYPDRLSLRDAAAAALSSTPKYAHDRLRLLERLGHLQPSGYNFVPGCAPLRPGPVQPTAAAAAGKTLKDWQAQYDIKARIRENIAARLQGVYLTDTEFREACDVPIGRWRRNAEDPEFKPYRLRLHEVTYWALPEMIRQMREIAGV